MKTISLVALHSLRTCLRALLLRFRCDPLFRAAVAVATVLVAALVLDPQAGLALPFAVGAALTEGQHTGEFILSEANGNRSRDAVTVTVSANTTLAAGMVLGKITATGKYVPYDEAAVDGSQTAAGVLYGELVNDTAGAVDMDGVIVTRDAEVRTDDLQWKAGVDEAGGIVDLAGRGVIAR